MSFTEIGFRADNLVKLDIRINGEEAPPLATIVHRDKAHDIGKKVCDKLKELIPRQQFKVRPLCRSLFLMQMIQVTIALQNLLYT